MQESELLVGEILSRMDDLGHLGKENEEELEKLKRKLQIGYELKVIWTPDDDSNLSGEVIGNDIFIYKRDKEGALETLRHEFLDYAISQTIEPYRQVANKLIKLINEQAYKKKEKLVESLKNLI